MERDAATNPLFAAEESEEEERAGPIREKRKEKERETKKNFLLAIREEEEEEEGLPQKKGNSRRWKEKLVVGEFDWVGGGRWGDELGRESPPFGHIFRYTKCRENSGPPSLYNFGPLLPPCWVKYGRRKVFWMAASVSSRIAEPD